MEENDKIQKLFKERFESFEAPVDPKLWSGVESSLGSAAPATGISMLSTKAIVSMVIVATTVAAGVSISLLNNEVEPSPQELVTIVKSVSNTEYNITSENELSSDEIDTFNSSEDPVTEELVNRVATSVDIGIENGVTHILEDEDVHKEHSLNATDRNVSTAKENSVKLPTEIISAAPKSIVVQEQSRVEAYPAGGIAPLNVAFSSIAEVQDIKWIFDDGTESTELNPNHEFEQPGIYFVTMLAELKDGSVVMDKAVIEVKENIGDSESTHEISEIKVNNIITPNGDGSNDELVVNMKGIYSYSISIYSKNGKLVFQSNNPMENWSGTDLRGNRVTDGTYFYLINALGEDKKVYSPKGYITVRGAR